MSDTKATDTKAGPGLDPRRSVAGPRTELTDDPNASRGMPSVGDVVLYQLAPDVHGLAFSRPMIVTSANSVNQHINGYLFLDTAMDSFTTGGAVVNIGYGGPGQSDTWHWPVKGYTGRADSPVLTPLSSVEVAEEVATVAAANAAVEAEADAKADAQAQAELDAAAEEAATETHPRRTKGEKADKHGK